MGYEEYFVPHLWFVALIVIVYYLFKAFKVSRLSRERMAMIEKGYNLEEISHILKEEKENKNTNNYSSTFFLIGASTGLLIGYALTSLTTIDKTLAYITCAFLFGGIGLVVGFIVNKDA